MLNSNLVLGSIALTTVLPTVKAGPLYPLCVAACIAAAVANPALVPLLPQCVALCAGSCLSNKTTITVKENGENIQKNIQEAKPGDFVLTVKDEQPYWTKVQSNVKMEGKFEFIQITAQNLKNSTQFQHFEVTPEHGLVFYHVDSPMTINAAKNIKVEDTLIGSNNNKLVVTEIDQVVLDEKYTLETSEGTLLASDFFITTLCEDAFTAGESLFEQTMADWQNKHSILGELLPENRIGEGEEVLI